VSGLQKARRECGQDVSVLRRGDVEVQGEMFDGLGYYRRVFGNKHLSHWAQVVYLDTFNITSTD